MHVIKNELTVAFDCDDTLVLWNKENHPKAITFLCPYTKEHIRLVPHTEHIKLLKDYKGRGYNITVWSAGGWEWAETVVKTLELENYVDIVQNKMIKYVDDLPGNEILGTRVFINFRGD